MRASVAGTPHRPMPRHPTSEGLPAPMRLQRRAEIHRAGFARGLVADGDDDVRRVAFESIVALAAQARRRYRPAATCSGCVAAPGPGETAGAHRLETGRRQVVEQRFGQDAAAAVGRAHEQTRMELLAGGGCQRLRRSARADRVISRTGTVSTGRP
jgi:hypothetical protein